MILEPEHLLVEAAQQGCVESFGRLYERYYKSMVALAYSSLTDRQLAEDAAQETFVIACRDLVKLKSKDKFAAWLAGICRNVAKQMLRKKTKGAALTALKPPRKSCEASEHAEAIRRAVWKLRRFYREPIVLRYYDNMPYDRIAAVLGISVQAVNGRIIRAKDEIAKYLKHNGFTGGGYETG